MADDRGAHSAGIEEEQRLAALLRLGILDSAPEAVFEEAVKVAAEVCDAAVLASGISKTVEETSPGPENSVLYWRAHKFVIKQEGAPALLLGGLCLDISSEHETVARLRHSHAELQEANQQLAALSITDTLTGLSNRRDFETRLRQALDKGTRVALILLDIDNFKSLNDSFGHLFGDDVLKSVAGLLQKVCRDEDCVARYGGEEFALLLSSTREVEAIKIAERLRLEVELHPWSERKVTASLGLAICSSSKSVPQVIAAADQALYKAKQDGRNRVCQAPQPD